MLNKFTKIGSKIKNYYLFLFTFNETFKFCEDLNSNRKTSSLPEDAYVPISGSYSKENQKTLTLKESPSIERCIQYMKLNHQSTFKEERA